jgi:spore germination cell wall hydrolase CwlJ-like protein
METLNKKLSEILMNILKRFSAETILLFCLASVLLSYILSSEFQSEKVKEPKWTVTATLEKDYTPPKLIPQKKRYAELMSTNKIIKLNNKEFSCLAKNIYFESKYEGYMGKVAVANVTYNRLKSKRWGNTFCSVVYSDEQFSWTIYKRFRNEKPKGEMWKQSKMVAHAFSNGLRVKSLEKANHYHGNYIPTPKWAKNMKKEVEIGRHVFYTGR